MAGRTLTSFLMKCGRRRALFNHLVGGGGTRLGEALDKPGFDWSFSERQQQETQWIARILGVVERKCSPIGGKLELVGDNPVDNSSVGSVNVMV
jgi:hypothetical protein